MSRSNVRVRAAEAGDLEALATLAEEFREVVTGRARRAARLAGRGAGDDARDRFGRLLADPAHRLIVAADDASGEVLGMAILGVDAASAVMDMPSVYVSHMLVAPPHRRRGAGRALVAAAVAYAEECNLEHVIVGVSTGGREANRFYARLGFVPLVLRRIAPVGALRRSLGLVEAADGRPHATRRRSPRVGFAMPRTRVR